MAQSAEMTNLAVWYTHISATGIIAGLTGAIKKEFERGVERAFHRDHLQVLA